MATIRMESVMQILMDTHTEEMYMATHIVYLMATIEAHIPILIAPHIRIIRLNMVATGATDYSVKKRSQGICWGRFFLSFMRRTISNL